MTGFEKHVAKSIGLKVGQRLVSVCLVGVFSLLGAVMLGLPDVKAREIFESRRCVSPGSGARKPRWVDSGLNAMQMMENRLQ